MIRAGGKRGAAQRASLGVTAPAERARDPILRSGTNCWRVERAERFRCVQDAEEYFRLVREAILVARHSIFVLGWDIYAAVDLVPGGVDDGAPTRLGELLDFAVRRNPGLQVYVLVWDYAALYALERDPTSRIRLGWQSHARVHFRFDDLHPLAASHHQKVVVVDDRLAFSGGLDLTSHRWDEAGHPAEHPLRVTAMGEPYSPFHDVQALVEGPVAYALGELARDRWRRLGQRRLPALHARTESLWPASVEPDLVNVEVAIARTDPRFRKRAAVRECEALFYDEIAAARSVIYIENQYFTNAKLGEALAKRLREPDGPEIVILGPRECSGWLEQKTMGALRRAVLVNLLDSDRHGRLRLLHPVASKARNVCTFVHSKILVIDDVHLRIGSANLSNRSMGMDTECDLIAVAGDDARLRAGIRLVRDRLVGEHLGLAPEEVSRAVEQHGSLRAAIDALSTGDRRLEPVEVDRDARTETWEALRSTIDPEEPTAVSRTIDRLLPALDQDDERKGARAVFVAACATGLLAIVARAASGAAGFEAASVRQLILDISSDAGAVRWVFAGLVAGGLLFLPFELLVLVPVVLLGGLRGGALALAAGALCAAVGYAIGRVLGPRPITPLLGRRAQRIWRALGGNGALSIAIVRFVALFSATSVHVLCGAARIPLREYAAGTALGLAPAWIAALVSGVLLRRAILAPSPWITALTVLVALALAFAGLRVRRGILMRQHGEAAREQRNRARFG